MTGPRAVSFGQGLGFFPNQTAPTLQPIGARSIFAFMSQSAPKRRMITSALPYANGPIHLGHIAGAYLPADIHVRHLRSMGGGCALDLWER